MALHDILILQCSESASLWDERTAMISWAIAVDCAFAENVPSFWSQTWKGAWKFLHLKLAYLGLLIDKEVKCIWSMKDDWALRKSGSVAQQGISTPVSILRQPSYLLLPLANSQLPPSSHHLPLFWYLPATSTKSAWWENHAEHLRQNSRMQLIFLFQIFPFPKYFLFQIFQKRTKSRWFSISTWVATQSFFVSTGCQQLILLTMPIIRQILERAAAGY